MATPLEISENTDEQVIVQGDVTFMEKMVESLVVKFDQAKYEEFLERINLRQVKRAHERSKKT